MLSAPHFAVSTMAESPPIALRRLGPEDAATFQALRLQALREMPSAFAASHEEESALPLEVVAGRLRPGSGRHVFGAFAGTDLVGCVGVGRETARKVAHKGFVRSLYVAEPWRRQGLGRRLMHHALDVAGTLPGVRQVTLVATAGNVAARGLYEAMGFRAYGVEPDALCVDGVFHDDVLMVLHLPPPQP